MAQSISQSWDIIGYEVRMFYATYEIVLDPSTLSQLPKVFANAVEESAVLHTRLLCDVFLSKTIGPDDIQMSELFPDFNTSNKYGNLKAKIRRLRNQYGTSQRHGSHCWIFNKMMAHPTKYRGISYDYTAILRNLRPTIKDVITEIESIRGATFTWSW